MIEPGNCEVTVSDDRHHVVISRLRSSGGVARSASGFGAGGYGWAGPYPSDSSAFPDGAMRRICPRSGVLVLDRDAEPRQEIWSSRKL